MENRVEVLEDALTNIYQKFNELVNTLNDKQKIVFDCLDKTCKNSGGNDAPIFVTIQPPYVITDYDRQNLPQDVQCANEILVEHKVEQIRTEMSELMVSYNCTYLITSSIFRGHPSTMWTTKELSYRLYIVS